MENELFELTKEQKRAFNRLKKAHADCLKSGIMFYNNYGSYGAVDSAKIREYDDNEMAKSEKAIRNDGQNYKNELSISQEWTDDQHYFHPTE